MGSTGVTTRARAVLAVLTAALLLLPASAGAAAGDINNFAGTGSSGHAGDGNPATSAGFAYPTALFAAPSGTVFVSDYLAHRVRRVTSGGTISTFAGTGTSGFSGDTGPATGAALANPGAPEVDAAGNLYIADSANHRIRKVAVDGTISTYAGTGSTGWTGDGGAATLATLSTPVGLEFDNAGNLLIADVGNHTIRKVSPLGTITTVAGQGTAGWSGDGGPATAAHLSEPRRVAVGRDGDMFIADTANARIRRINPGGTITTWAGTGTPGFSGDGGPAASAQINRPTGLDIDSAGTVFVAEEGNDVIRKITPAGVISRVAGPATGVSGSSGDGGPATSARLNDPRGISIEPDGDLLFADSANYRVRRITRLAAPGTPTLTGTTPASPGTSESIQVRGTSETGFTVRLYTTNDCSGGAAATGTAAAFGSPGLSVTVPSDSTRTFYATATDSFGAVSGCSRTSATYVEDSTAPAAPSIGTGPASPGSGRAPQWTFSGEGGATLQCKLTSGSGDVLADWADCTSPKSFSLTGQADGGYTFAVRARDAAGNISLESSDSYMLDTTAPVPPTVGTSPATPSTGRSPSWAFTGEGGADMECRLDLAGVQVYGWEDCDDGSHGFDLTGEDDGVYTFSVRATDAAANVGTPATRAYELDTTDPAEPTISATPSSPGNDRSPAWEWTGEDGEHYHCRLQSGGIDVEPMGHCASPHSYDLDGKPDGDYVFSVYAADAAENEGPAATHTYSLNTALPATPTIDAAQASPGRGRSPEWTFSTSEGGVTLECRLDIGGVPVFGWEDCDDGTHSFDLAGKSDGAYTFSVRADNGLTQGAPATAVYTLDTAAPGVPTFPSGPTSPGLDETPEWTLAATGAAVKFECRVTDAGGTVESRDPCTSPASFDLSAEPDGAYVLEARAFDAAGNDSAWGASTAYSLDTTAPGNPTVTAPTTPSSDETPTWSYSASGASGFECRVERGAIVVDDWAACASPWTYDLDGEPDATYTVRIRSRDSVGNRSTGVTTTYRVDRSTPAAPTIVATPGPLGKSRDPEWGFEGAAGLDFECRLASGTTELHAWADCTSPRAWSLGGRPDGEYKFAVRTKNDVDTVSAAVSETYELDATAPPAPVVDSEPPVTGTDRAPTWSFHTEHGAGPECRLDRGATPVEGWATCVSPRVVDLGGRPDGRYTLSLRAVDSAGNESALTTRDYDLDMDGPAAPNITASAQSPGNTRLPSWSWDAESGLTYECSLARPGGATDDWAACTTPNARDLGGQPDGRYELRVRGVDAAGNRGTPATAAYDLDTQPGALSVTAGPVPAFREGSPSWSWQGEAGATFRCRILRGGDVRTDWAPCTSPHTVAMAGDPDGAYTFAVAASDAAGNQTPDATWSFAIDRTPPAPAVYDASPPARSRDRTPSWTFASEAGVRYECRVEQGPELVYDWRECVSPLKVDLRESDDGAYSLLVRTVDEAGNSAQPATTTYRLDTTDPEVPDIASKPDSDGADRTPTWAFRAEARAELECRLKQEGEDAPAWRACESPKTFDLDSKPDGTYTFGVRARDVAGNTGAIATDVYRMRVAAAARAGDDAGAGDASPSGDAAPGAAPPAAPGAPGAPPTADPDAPAADDADDPAADDDAGTKAGAAAGRGGPGAGAAKGSNGSGQGAESAGGAAEEDKKRRRPEGNVAQQALKQIAQVGAVIAESPEKGVFPMSLIFVVAGFMGLQSRIDRNDPKLALAPVFADPDLEFRPPRAARAGLETA